MAVFVCLTCLERVCKKICSKKYCFVEQSLYKLKTKKAKMAKTDSNPIMVETTNTLAVKSLSPVVYLLPLANLFTFNLSFS